MDILRPANFGTIELLYKGCLFYLAIYTEVIVVRNFVSVLSFRDACSLGLTALFSVKPRHQETTC